MDGLMDRCVSMFFIFVSFSPFLCLTNSIVLGVRYHFVCAKKENTISKSARFMRKRNVLQHEMFSFEFWCSLENVKGIATHVKWHCHTSKKFKDFSFDHFRFRSVWYSFTWIKNRVDFRGTSVNRNVFDCTKCILLLNILNHFQPIQVDFHKVSSPPFLYK